MKKALEKRVLIYLVDDDELHIKILKSKFDASTNFKMHLFNSGEEFLEAIIKKPPPKNGLPILILDYQLTTEENEDAKNGIEILKIVKEVNPDFDVIMLSGYDDVDIATSAMHYGAKTFVKKNENSFVRIENTINWIISQRLLSKKEKASKSSSNFFIILIIGIIIAAIAYATYYFFIN